MIELYNKITGFSANVIYEVPLTKKIIFNLRNLTAEKTTILRTKRFGMKSIRSRANQLWRILPNVIKSLQSISSLKTE